MVAIYIYIDMGVSINGGTPKWMVYRENPIKMNDLGVPMGTTILGRSHIYIYMYIYIHIYIHIPISMLLMRMKMVVMMIYQLIAFSSAKMTGRKRRGHVPWAIWIWSFKPSLWQGGVPRMCPGIMVPPR